MSGSRPKLAMSEAPNLAPSARMDRLALGARKVGEKGRESVLK